VGGAFWKTRIFWTLLVLLSVFVYLESGQVSKANLFAGRMPFLSAPSHWHHCAEVIDRMRCWCEYDAVVCMSAIICYVHRCDLSVHWLAYDNDRSELWLICFVGDRDVTVMLLRICHVGITRWMPRMSWLLCSESYPPWSHGNSQTSSEIIYIILKCHCACNACNCVWS